MRLLDSETWEAAMGDFLERALADAALARSDGGWSVARRYACQRHDRAIVPRRYTTTEAFPIRLLL